MATPSNPSNPPATAPGTALRTMSTPADGRWCRRLLANSVTENSTPKVSSSNTTPMGALVVTNSPAAATGQMPPLPSDKPASSTPYGGQREWRAAAPNTASVVRRAPSSNSSAHETCTSSASFDDLLDTGDAVFGADHDQNSWACSISAGPGEASTSSLRTMATMDAPVRVRRGCPRAGGPRMGFQPGLARPASRPGISWAAR